MPLISRNRVLGTLYVTGLTRTGPDAFDLLAAIGSQIGAALERARLYQDAQQRSEDLAILNEIARAVTSSLELDRVLTTSLHSIRQILHVEAGSLILVDSDSGELQFRNTLPALETWIRRDAAQPGGGLIGTVTTLREPLIIKDAQVLHAEAGDEIALRNLLAVPLIAKSRVLGVIVVINRIGRRVHQRRSRIAAISGGRGGGRGGECAAVWRTGGFCAGTGTLPGAAHSGREIGGDRSVGRFTLARDQQSFAGHSQLLAPGDRSALGGREEEILSEPGAKRSRTVDHAGAAHAGILSAFQRPCRAHECNALDRNRAGVVQ